MTEIKKDSATGRALLRWLFAAAFVFAVVASGLFSGLMNRAGLFYLAVGWVAVAFMGFTWREIGQALRTTVGRTEKGGRVARAAYFWLAAARNAWILGVLGSALNFSLALSSESGGIADISSRMIQSLVVTLYGLVLAVVCMVPAIKLDILADRMPVGGAEEEAAARPAVIERAVGYVIFAVVLGLTIASLVRGYPQTGPLNAVKVLLHGPAILVVLGGAIAVALFMGVGAGARALTLGFGLTGVVGLLMGLIQALFGFAHRSVEEIAAAIAFIISSSLFSLLGLGALAGPLEDREAMGGRREGTGALSRMFWILLPLLVFVFLVLAFIMIVTPMKIPG